MSKLYELLAVEPDLRQQAQAELTRVKELFSKGTGKLLGQVISFHGITEEAQELPEDWLILTEFGEGYPLDRVSTKGTAELSLVRTGGVPALPLVDLRIRSDERCRVRLDEHAVCVAW